MKYEMQEIELHRLNIPAETLRRGSSPASDETLKESLLLHGVMSPFVVSRLGSKEFAVWDGTRRTRLLKEIGVSTKTKVPAMVVEGDDDQSLIAQVNINNTRERLSELAEVEALRQLVEDHGYKQGEAAKKLLKSKQWASDVLKVLSLPKPILKKLRDGILPLSHAKIISGYINQPDIVKMLIEQSETGNVTGEHLKALALQASQHGITEALKRRPKKHNITDKSWFRIVPLQKGIRAELHIDDAESLQKAIDVLTKELKSLLVKKTLPP